MCVVVFVVVVRCGATLSSGIVARSKVSTAIWCRRGAAPDRTLYTQPFCTFTFSVGFMYVVQWQTTLIDAHVDIFIYLSDQ